MVTMLLLRYTIACRRINYYWFITMSDEKPSADWDSQWNEDMYSWVITAIHKYVEDFGKDYA